MVWGEMKGLRAGPTPLTLVSLGRWAGIAVAAGGHAAAAIVPSQIRSSRFGLKSYPQPDNRLRCRVTIVSRAIPAPLILVLVKTPRERVGTMWSTLVELIERWWREKPRLDVVRSVVCLRDAMEACNTSYKAYRDATSRGAKDGAAELQRLRAEWGVNVEVLTEQVIDLGTVLQIFSPKLHMEVIDYHGDERVGFDLADDALYMVASEMRQAPEIDIARVELTDKYQTALAELDAFIRSNFKLEAVHAVTSSRWR